MTQNYVLRLMAAGFDAWKLSVQVAETLVASQLVINTRLAMVGGSMNGTAKPPIDELNRLIPEKTAAFGKAGVAASRAMMGRGKRPMTLSGALLADNMIMLDWWERSLSAAGAWWMPVHAQATANARRLSGRRSVH